RPALGGIPLRQLPNVLGLLAGWRWFESAGWAVQAAVFLCAGLLLIRVALLRRFAGEKDHLGLCVSCAVIVALLVGYSTNTYDLSLLVLPLALIADYCTKNAKNRAARTWLLLPAIPLLISPLWFFLWMSWVHINVIAIFLIWWMLAITQELMRIQTGHPTAQAVSAHAESS